MSILYPRLPASAAKELFAELGTRTLSGLGAASDTTHLAQYFAPTGGTRATPDSLLKLRGTVVDIARGHGFPDVAIGRAVNNFDTELARVLHTNMGLVPAEAAIRPIWAFLALVVLPDVAVWRFPRPPEDRILATDITRHVYGRLWWRAELLRDETNTEDPYHLLGVFPERNFDQILSRRRSIGGSPELVRSLAKAWPKVWTGPDEREVLIDTLKHLMRRGAFQDLFGLPEELLRSEITQTIAFVWNGRNDARSAPVRAVEGRPAATGGRHARL